MTVFACELTADVGQAAAAVSSRGDQSLVLSADGDVGLTELRIALCNAKTFISKVKGKIVPTRLL